MEEILQTAIQNYRAEFGKDFDPAWDLRTEADLAECIESSSTKFRTWRSRHQGVWNGLLACTAPIISLGTMAQSGSDAFSPGASAAIGGLVSLVKACQGVSEAYDYIEEMFGKLEDVLGRWKIDLRHEIADYLKQKMQQIIFVIFSIIARSRVLIKRNRMRQYFKTLVFGKDEKTEELMQELEKLLQSEDRARMTLSLERLNALWQKAVHTESQQSIELLKTSAFKSNAMKFSEKREELISGTGAWFRQEQLYQAWMRNETSVLMVLGLPGSGKSFLATSLIDELLQKYPPSSSATNPAEVGYFYVDKDQSLVTMLKTMASQVQQVDIDFRRHAIDVLELDDLHTLKTVWSRLFQGFWNLEREPNKRLVLVIDGLDEGRSEEVEYLAQEIVKELMRTRSIYIQFAIFGRLKLRSDFDYISNGGFIHVDPKKNEKDISAYIDKEFAKIRVLRRLTAEERRLYHDKLLEFTDGVFEWARLLLSRCRNREKHRILEMIENPPKGLDSMIETCFEEISNDEDMDPAVLRSLLTCTAYSKRSLMFGELYNAICIDTGNQHSLLWFYLVTKLSSVVQWKSSQLQNMMGDEVQEDSIEIREDDSFGRQGWSRNVSTAITSFSHARTRDFVITRNGGSSPSNDSQSIYPPTPGEAECEMTKRCIRILRQPNILDKNMKYLIRYPVRFLGAHLQLVDVRSVSDSDRTEIISGLIWLFTNEDAHKILLRDTANPQDGGADSFWRQWLASNDFAKLVQEWLQHPQAMIVAQSLEMADWVGSASASVKILYRPLVQSANKSWLTRNPFPNKPEDYSDATREQRFVISFLQAYYSLRDDGSLDPSLHNWTSDNMLWSPPEVEVVESLAIRAQLPRNIAWIIAVGGALYKDRAYVEAEAYFKEAYTENNNAWLAAWYLACVCANTNRIKEAVTWAEVAKKIEPHLGSSVDRSMAQWLFEVQDWDRANELAYGAAKARPDDLDTQVTCILCLGASGRVKELMDYFQALEHKAVEDRPYSMLTFVLKNTYWGRKMLGKVLNVSRSPEYKAYALESLRSAATWISQTEDEEDQATFQYHWAEFYHAYIDDEPARAIQLLTIAYQRVKDSQSFMVQTAKDKLLIAMRARLAKFLYEQVVLQLRTSNSEADVTQQTFKKLAAEALKVDESKEIGPYQYYATYPATLYGLFLRKHRNVQEVEWRGWFRQPLLRYLNMLEDDENYNDLEGLSRASAILGMAGDEVSAAALAGAVFLWTKKSTYTIQINEVATDQGSTQPRYEPSGVLEDLSSKAAELAIRDKSIGSFYLPTSSPEQEVSKGIDSNTEEDEEDKYEEEQPTAMGLRLSHGLDLRFSCSLCFRGIERSERMTYCEVCPIVVYCGVCEATEEIDMVFGRACGKQHHKVQIWPVPDHIRDSALVQVEGGGYDLSRSWLHSLKSSWA